MTADPINRMTTGDIVAEALIANGVDTVFGLPGAHTYDFTDALARRSNALRFVTARHEQGAAYMAYGYAKATGRVGVFTVVPGPGILNAAAALATAYGAGAPVLGITGNVFAHLIGRGRGQLHELPDQPAALRGVIDWTRRIDHPADAASTMAAAFAYLQSGRTRPAVIEAPWDVFGKSIPAIAVEATPAPPPRAPDPQAVEAAAAAIGAARRPLIVVGGGALAAGPQIADLARKIGAATCDHRSGKGVVPADAPHHLTAPAAYEYFQTADLVIGIGSRLEMVDFRWRTLPPGQKRIRIDTDPTEFVRNPCDAPILADAALGTAALAAAAPARDAFDGADLNAAARARLETLQPQWDYLTAIRAALPRDGIFVEEICQAGFTARLGFPVYAPRTYIPGGYQDNLGFGFPTALGVKIARPDTPVVAIAGDGGFLFGVQEMATAVQHGIGVVVVLFDNGAFGNVHRDQRQKYDGRLLGSELHNPDFPALARSFGAKAVTVETPAALETAIRDNLLPTGPVLIHVPIPRGTETSPWPLYIPGGY